MYFRLDEMYIEENIQSISPTQKEENRFFLSPIYRVRR